MTENPGTEEAGGAARGGRTSTAGTALEKSMRILEAVAAPGGPHRLTGVAAAAAVPKSSTYRILASLIEQGFVRSEAESRYGVGPRLRGLSALVSGGEPAGVEQILRELQQSTGQAVHLALHSGETITYIRKLESDQPFRTASRIGMRMPLHTTAIGKCILAHLPRAEVRELLSAAGLPRRTPNTITGAEALEAELASVRERGFALDDEENEPTIRCIGAVILGPTGLPVGGVSVTTVTFLVSREEIEAYAPALRSAALALTPLL
ncbi:MULTISPECIES: IclR family transcriptional regulator [unclassified Streptomyces]|uniref:IclR family transcriptional regulator n=1 Tax=unclassified Streptomyces TaxID=2593676 RepID=UPI000DC7D763|nr:MULTISPECIES: IclR family transcriptional regulator [unclassified Streptomyces]AWZ09078.1 IclR family transcriptional regulator [Streptomyces sp. ICC4]AWZ15822.1 IclR family transcriptional regulator [Streptomyces sp. ICC1]